MRATTWAIIAAATWAPACAFLLDFDELQKAQPAATGGTGGGAAAGAGGMAGEGGASCAAKCNDGDPCTWETCDAMGQCLRFSNGVASDGFAAVAALGDNVEAITWIGSERGFTAAVRYTTGGVSDARFYRLEPTGAELVEGPLLSELTQQATLQLAPGTRVALAQNPAFPYELVSFVALVSSPTDKRAQVWQLSATETFGNVSGSRVSAVGLSDLGVNDKLPGQGPIAWATGDNRLVGAWVAEPIAGQNRTIILRRANAGANDRITTTTDEDVLTIAPLGNELGDPGVLYSQAATSFAQIVSSRPSPASPVDFCPTEARFFNYVSSASRTPIPGLWFAALTRADLTGAVTSELHGVICGGTTCVIPELDCAAQPVPGQFLPTTAAMAIQGEPSILTEVVLLPSTDGALTRLTLGVLRVNLDQLSQSLVLTPPEGYEVLNTARIGGPALATIALAPPNKVAVAFDQLNPETGHREAHFRRFDYCPPTPDDLAGKRPTAVGAGGAAP